eukprot:CAMPEP_0184495284 /NCGR_PEP_ID=MMETSP0113_2-20130426/30854_1 /TAXON_ID=91329 /ORGANISM="Norrisiella sphaerica, Strain BC52" /LENGTH=178 /DNA_ID=CAMNT_0026881399 /DNA_START=185 /DNA_END=721 /DNA_ORIENTATION=+
MCKSTKYHKPDPARVRARYEHFYRPEEGSIEASLPRASNRKKYAQQKEEQDTDTNYDLSDWGDEECDTGHFWGGRDTKVEAEEVVHDNGSSRGDDDDDDDNDDNDTTDFLMKEAHKNPYEKYRKLNQGQIKNSNKDRSGQGSKETPRPKIARARFQSDTLMDLDPEALAEGCMSDVAG